MKVRSLVASSVPAATMLAIGAAMCGFGSAAADPADYSTLPVDPNDVTESQAYSAAPPVQNPNGQQGVEQVFTQRDGTKTITNTILVFPDPAAATAAINGSQAAGNVANGQPQPAAVGTGGQTVSGLSPDGSKSVTVLTYTEGNAATTIEFDSPPNEPAPLDLVTNYGQQQDSAIKAQLTDVCISCIGQ